MFFGTREDEAQRLHGEALAHLDRGELDEARRIAAELRGMRWSGAFEIDALAARAEGDLEGAVGALEEGVRLVPAAWMLWQLLGTFYDEQGRAGDARHAYDTALACEGAWASSIRFNRAVSRMRARDPGGALADAERVLEDPATPPFTLDALRVAIDALDALGRAGDAVSLVRAMIGSLAPGDVVGRAELESFAALAAARAGAAPETVRAALAAAIEGNASRPEIVEALTWIEREREVVDARFRVTISAPAPVLGDPEVKGYFRVIEVRASDEAHARELARSLEPSAIRDAITIEDCQRVATEPGPPGVIGASGRAYYGDA